MQGMLKRKKCRHIILNLNNVNLRQTRLVKPNLVYSSQSQSNLVKSRPRQILSNLVKSRKSFLGYFWQHIVHVVDHYSLVQSDLDQCRPIYSTLVKSRQILSNLVKSRKIFSRLFLAAYSARGGSLQSSLVWSRLVQTNLVYSSQIQSNLDKSFLGYFWRHFGCIKLIIGSLQSSLVKFSLFN